ncbi:hypothetical protein [Stenotrophomonas sp.]|uniref:hypothetical protein n=1 Tax=Stenotrophomonas sp. TaxID=69392 RepID=UPI00289D8EFE|nr:hypothetical protein [Stenotrophomonas sp.]
MFKCLSGARALSVVKWQAQAPFTFDIHANKAEIQQAVSFKESSVDRCDVIFALNLPAVCHATAPALSI